MEHQPSLAIIDPEQGMDTSWVHALLSHGIADIAIAQYTSWDEILTLVGTASMPIATGLLIHNQQCDLLALSVLRRYNDSAQRPVVWVTQLEAFELEAIQSLTRIRPRMLRYTDAVMQEVWETLRGLDVRKQLLQRQQQLRGLMRLAQTVREQPEANLETYIREVASALANIAAADRVFVIVSHGDQLQAAHCFQRIEKTVIEAPTPQLQPDGMFSIFGSTKPTQWMNGTLVQLYQKPLQKVGPSSLLAVPLNLFGYNKMVFCLEMLAPMPSSIIQDFDRLLPRLSAYVQ